MLEKKRQNRYDLKNINFNKVNITFFQLRFVLALFVQWVSAQGVPVQGVSIQGVSVQGVSVQGVSVQGVFVLVGKCPGGTCPGICFRTLFHIDGLRGTRGAHHLFWSKFGFINVKFQNKICPPPPHTHTLKILGPAPERKVGLW